MSGVTQKRKGVNRKRLTCTNGARFATREDAKAYIDKLRNKGQRGTARLRTYECAICKSKGCTDTIHVGHGR